MKQISVNTIKEFIKEHDKEQVVINIPVRDSFFELKINRNVTISDKSRFIRRVIDGCFDVADRFRVEYEMPMIKATILQMFTNIPVISVKDKQTDDGQAVMDVDAMEKVFDFITQVNEEANLLSMFSDVVYLCQEAVKHEVTKMNTNRSTSDRVNELLDDIINVVNKISEKIEDIDMEELIGISETITKITNGINENNIIKELVKNSK